ncbi:MAG: AAA family ATPase [Bacteroidetes bacterium]|nr:AAA family ATPase [Bacteroidota bacterium]
MKLKSFRITNYKSIIDSKECRLSEHDNITVIAGQNESGKSSILQALRDFENETISIEAIREDDTFPSILCTYSVSVDTLNIDKIFGKDDSTYPSSLKKIVTEIKEISIQKDFNRELECTTKIILDAKEKMYAAISKENERIDERNSKVLTGEEKNEQVLDRHDPQIVEDLLSDLILSIPTIIFFDDFCDLLPDQILISELKEKKTDTKGYQAVKNIETILAADFSSLDGLTDGRRERTQSSYHETITAVFNEKWKQRISEGDGAKIHVKYYQGKAESASYLKFFIVTKKGEFLTPGKRSQGFKWFLSFFLQLKAESERSNQLIILFDEPGLYLHSKAQADMIAVFEELSAGNQIIYSTHSPYLINTSKIHRIKLILNTKKIGTTIEKITTDKITNQKDALKPIVDAIGLETATPFSVGSKNNIILEGISDFHYFNAMKKILNKDYELGILPSMGSSNVHLLMELCIGWGLNWVIFFDDKGATKDFNKIKKSFFDDNEEEIIKKVFRIKECDGIEDVFVVGDMKLVNQEFTLLAEHKNSETVSEFGGKELYARLFYEKVLDGQITKEKLSKTAVKKFEEFFAFIELSFKLNNEKSK